MCQTWIVRQGAYVEEKTERGRSQLLNDSLKGIIGGQLMRMMVISSVARRGHN